MFEQIKLSFEMDALEPYIDKLTMETHYGKHHATYTKNFNDLVEKVPGLKGKTAEDILSHLEDIPDEYRTAVRNNGGGYLSHNIYFGALSPHGGGEPTGKLAEHIQADFGSFDSFKNTMSTAGVGQFGSGYAWLVCHRGKLDVCTTANQDTPINKGIMGVLLNLDVWEHAYYLKYKNLRPDYIKAFWNVVDWKIVEQRYTAAR